MSDDKRLPRTAGEHRANLAATADYVEQPFARDVLDKAPDDEPVFILRAQDRSAVDAVESWIMFVETRAGGQRSSKTMGAREVVKAMRTWQKTHPTKAPD